jgi:chromosome partitioning protein
MPIIVSFVSQKGGVGKSTLARALLAVAAHAMKARLADLDPRQGSVVAWERARQRNAAGPPCEVVPYATAGEALAASGDVDLLILDTPAGTSRATLEIARHSHLVVQPTGPSADDLLPTILTFHELVKEGVPKERLAIAICRVLSAGEEATVRAYVEDAGYEVLAGAIAERIAYREAQNRGQAITETKSAKLNEQADALMEALLDKVMLEIKRRQGTERGKRTEMT